MLGSEVRVFQGAGGQRSRFPSHATHHLADPEGSHLGSRKPLPGSREGSKVRSTHSDDITRSQSESQPGPANRMTSDSLIHLLGHTLRLEEEEEEQ